MRMLYKSLLDCMTSDWIGGGEIFISLCLYFLHVSVYFRMEVCIHVYVVLNTCFLLALRECVCVCKREWATLSVYVNASVLCIAHDKHISPKKKRLK